RSRWPPRPASRPGPATEPSFSSDYSFRVDWPSALAQRSERRADLFREQLGLLPRREVAALVDLVEVDQVAIGSLDPSSGRTPDLPREDREGRGHGDLALVGDARVLPVEPR